MSASYGSHERVSAYCDPEQLLAGNVSGPVHAVSVRAKTYDPFGLKGRRRTGREGGN